MLTHSVKKIRDTWDHYISLTKIQEDNQFLKNKIKQLKQEALKNVEQLKTFERLSKVLEYKLASENEMVLATVIGADSLSWSRMITIDRGTSDGVEKNMAVVTHKGLVGHIIQVAPGFSKVLLITDVRNAVDALDQNYRTRGVVVGKGSNTCEMKYISQDADIQVGDPVISSGLGGVFPKGLLIGKVSQVGESKEGLFKNVTITPAVKLSFLEEVFVLKEPLVKPAYVISNEGENLTNN